MPRAEMMLRVARKVGHLFLETRLFDMSPSSTHRGNIVPFLEDESMNVH